ncbi:uncharacterized protein LALA0_S12e00122g [Lachancea lanzarotensis]|uniref:LALA0S12e00122g1_1 n=1 Tax=Lachancea lanzarotensis TaxID=1245769 RepID=A0A0C7NDV4_9SACH|nr:uncharacterized protein LALA0_S12e00122g [Lachancea lanzarotensis]CEP64496.1 LALA0S12e00122g1_1 [Lachancea lanzarotensis]
MRIIHFFPDLIAVICVAADFELVTALMNISDVDTLLQTPLNLFTESDRLLISDGFTFTNTSKTVRDVLELYQLDTPAATPGCLVFFDNEGNEIAREDSDTSDYPEAIMTSYEDARNQAQDPSIEDDKDAVDEQLLLQHANEVLNALQEKNELEKRGNPTNYICGFNWDNCRSYTNCNKEYSPGSGMQCKCIGAKKGPKACLTRKK